MVLERENWQLMVLKKGFHDRFQYVVAAVVWLLWVIF